MFRKKILKANFIWRNHHTEEAAAPKDEEIENQLEEIFSSILISEERKQTIKKLTPNAKWKLICEYKSFIEANKNSLKYISTKEISQLLEKLSNQPTIIDFHEARNWFLRASEGDVNLFCLYGGSKILFKQLEEAEKISRITKNYRKQMEILKLLEILAKMPDGPQQILKIKNSFDILLLNLHWINMDMTSLSLEIITHLLWNSNESHEFLLEALNKYKTEKKIKNRFDLFLYMLNKSKNILMVENWLCFLNSMISSCTNENKRLILKSELLASGANKIFEKIKIRIAKKQYELEDCLFDKIQQELMDIKYSELENIAFFNEDKDPVTITEEIKELCIEENGKMIIDIQRLQNFICGKRISPKDNQVKENILNDKEAEEEENPNLYDLNNYLKETDHTLFEDHLVGVLNQIEVFEKLVNVEKKRKSKILNLEGFLNNKRDCANIYDLIDQIKDNVFERENYDHFLLILQYLIMIPNNEDGDELWDTTSELLESLIYRKENIEMSKSGKKDPTSQDILKKRLQEMEEKNKQLEEEIKQHLHAKNELNLQLIQLRSQKDSPDKLPLNSSIKQEAKQEEPKPLPLLPPPPPFLNNNVPPPPLISGGLGGPGGPPPINLLNKPLIKQKEKKKPRIPMRGLMWNGISKLDDVKQTIFENIEEDKIKIDLDAFEEDFKEKAVEKKAIAKEVVKKPEKITLIEPKRGKMYDILLAKLKLNSMETVAVSLYTCDEKILSLDCLELLIPVIPTEEEVKVCSAYKGDKNLLANPERFILALSVIKGFGNRIRALHFFKTSKDLIEDLEQKAENTEKIWKVILEDKKIHLLFKYILAHGNYMNGTSMRGGMYGFSFDSLEKVVDCRSTNNPKRNLLIYLLEYIHKIEEKSLIEEHFSLFDYDFISKLPVSQLDLDLQEIKKGSKYMDLALNSFSNDPSDRIVEVLQDSYNRILIHISTLDTKIKSINELYQKVQKYLCEDSKETSDKTAKKILFMWQNILNWKKELERKKREEERKKAAALKKNKNMALPVELKTPVKRAVVNVLDEKNSNLNNFIAGKANPDEIIKDLHERRKAKKNMLGISLKAAMIAKMMYKKMKKSMMGKKNNAEPLKKENTNDLLKELISNRLKS